MEVENESNLDNWPESMKKVRSKSLPTSSLIDIKNLKPRLEVAQQKPIETHENPLSHQRNHAFAPLPNLQMGIEILSNSAKDIELEKKRMEYVLEKQKKLQDDLLSARNNRRKSLNIFFGFATDNSSETSIPLSSLPDSPSQVGTFTKWKRKIHTKVSSGKNLRTAEEGHKRATKAMVTAGDWIMQMGDSLQQEEERLRKRAQDLRRVSIQAFKLMSDIKRDDQEFDDSSSDNEFETKYCRNGGASMGSFNSFHPKDDDDDFDNDTFYGCIDVDERKEQEKNRRHSYLDGRVLRDPKFDKVLSDELNATRTNSEKMKRSCGFSKNKLQKAPSCPLDKFNLVRDVESYTFSDLEKRASGSPVDNYLWSENPNPEVGLTIKPDAIEELF